MKALIPKIINGRIIITNKNDYDEVHITVDEMEDILNNAYQQGAKEFAEWLYRRNCFDGWYKFDGNEEVKLTTDEILAEWQKGKENETDRMSRM